MNNTVTIPEDFSIKNILIVDDDPQVLLILSKMLEKAGFHTQSTSSTASALELLEKERFDLVISDIIMPEKMDGIGLLSEIKNRYPDTDVIMMTGYEENHSYVEIMDAGASDYMSKPFRLDSVYARIKRIAREKTNLIKLKKTNQELCRAIERSNHLAREAEEASKAKTFFLASMSHEIRTPLNGIVGYTDMLLDTSMTDEQKMFLKNAKLSCETLLSVVNDILDFSKVEAGKMTLENMEFDPEVLCFDTIDVIRTKVDESKVELLCRVSEKVPGKVIGDPHKFRQVLLNLLGNAVKFTPSGMIKIELDAEDVGQETVQLKVAVKDTGIGISNSQLEKIFQPFVQSEDDITSRFGGTGLGLAISKNIANKMSGDVWALQRRNKGSVFYFTSTVKPAPKKVTARVKPVMLKGKKVVYSTQTDDAKDLFSHDFELAGMYYQHLRLDEIEPYFTEEKKGAFDIGVIDFGRLFKINSKEIQHKVIYNLPSNTGLDWIACSVPVPGIAERFRQAGFKGFLPKPVSRKKLVEMMSYLIGMSDETKGNHDQNGLIFTAHLVSENKKHSARILLVEDNPVNQKMTRLMLSRAGYSVDIASNGQVAVDIFSKDSDKYDLILMDINMPVMNGFEAAGAIRTLEKEHGDSRTPILALTANVLDDFKKKCSDSGMDDYLTKPVQRDQVFTAIQNWTSLSH